MARGAAGGRGGGRGRGSGRGSRKDQPTKKTEPEKKKKAIDRVHDIDSPSSKKMRAKRTPHQEILKIKYDHFRDFGDEEFFMVEVKGKNLYNTLKSDKEKWKRHEIEMGPRYYAGKRCDFQFSSATSDKLEAIHTDDPEDETLRHILKAFCEKSDNVVLFVDWVETVSEIN